MKPGLILLAFIKWITFSDSLSAQELRLITYNIRFANEADAPHTWVARKPLIIEQIRRFDPDIIGFQEALHLQVLELEDALHGYSRIGVGRDDGKEAGEYSPLFYRTDRFKILKSGTLWLSETPDKISIGWDAALPRIATWASMQDQYTTRKIFVINTHFDHIGQMARLNSIKLLIDFMVKSGSDHDHLVLMGDFNTDPQDEPYRWLMEQKLLLDPYFEATYRSGPAGTFNAFNYEHQSDRIDYIFLSPSLKAKQYMVLKESYNGILPSDHWPVIVVAE